MGGAKEELSVGEGAKDDMPVEGTSEASVGDGERDDAVGVGVGSNEELVLAGSKDEEFVNEEEGMMVDDEKCVAVGEGMIEVETGLQTES